MELAISDDCYITSSSSSSSNNNNNNNNKYDMKFSVHFVPLIMSITKTKILLGATITDNYKTVTWNATKVTTLPDFLHNKNKNKMPMNLIGKLIYHLSLQLNYLIEKHRKCFIGYSFKNILVIDDNIFAYIPNNEDICDIVDNNIRITYPFSLDDFYQSPETLSVNSIPSYIHYKSIYYSLACLIMDLLNPNTEKELLTKENYIERKEEILDTLFVKNSKLYYFLKRCLTKEAEKRSFLYI